MDDDGKSPGIGNLIRIFNCNLNLHIKVEANCNNKVQGEKLLTASFKMYHETLCEERDLLILVSKKACSSPTTTQHPLMNIATFQ